MRKILQRTTDSQMARWATMADLVTCNMQKAVLRLERSEMRAAGMHRYTDGRASKRLPSGGIGLRRSPVDAPKRRLVNGIVRPQTVSASGCVAERLPSGGSGLRRIRSTSVAVDAAKHRSVDGIAHTWTGSAVTHRYAVRRLHAGSSGSSGVRRASPVVDAAERPSVDGTARIRTLTARASGYVAERLPSGDSGLKRVGRVRDAVHAAEHRSVDGKCVGSVDGKRIGSLRQGRGEGWICGDKFWVYISSGA